MTEPMPTPAPKPTLVCIIRHGQALGSSPTGRDQNRTLTEVGHQQARSVGEQLKSCALPTMNLYASPYVRAQQTAADICSILDLPVHTDDRLGADHGLSDMLAVIEDHQTNHPDIPAIAIVSHMPTVGELESLLTRGPAAGGTSFSTGQLVVISIHNDELIAGGTRIELDHILDHINTA